MGTEEGSGLGRGDGSGLGNGEGTGVGNEVGTEVGVDVGTAVGTAKNGKAERACKHAKSNLNGGSHGLPRQRKRENCTTSGTGT